MARAALCCLCLLQVLAVLSEPERRGPSVHRGAEAGDAGVLSKGRPKALFARRGVHQQQRLRCTNASLAAVARGHHCSHGTESCGPHIPCCDPCSTCHCRFFNTICYCWRLGRHCTKKP